MNNTYKIAIPKSWWSHFTDEAICQDAATYMRLLRADLVNTLQSDFIKVGSGDWILHSTGELLELKPYGETKKVLRYEVTEQQLRTLHHHADWYAYFWKEESAAWGEDVLMWHAWARGSKTFADKLQLIIESIGKCV